VEKLSRREGVELFLKGERALNGKSALERRGPAPPPWLQADFEALAGTVLRLPNRSEISAPIDEHLIVELYSRL
jgi:ribosomal protein S4